MNTTVLPATAESARGRSASRIRTSRRQPLDAPAVVRLAEIIAQAFDHRIADLIERIHFLLGLLVALDELQARRQEGVPAAVAARERHRRRLADMADAERVDEPLQRNFAPRLDGAEQVAHRGLAESLDLFEMDFAVALLQREDIGGLLDPSLLVEQLDLLLAEAVDIEGAARHEVLEMLDGLIGTGKFAGAARDSAFLARRRSARAPRRCAADTGIFSGTA